MRRSLKKKLRVPEPQRWSDMRLSIDGVELPAENIFMTNRISVDGEMPLRSSSYEASGTVTLERDAAARLMHALGGPHVTRESLIEMVTQQLYAHGYRDAHVILGEVHPGLIRAHAEMFVPLGVLRVVEDELRDYMPMALTLQVTAIDCGHDDCHALPEMFRACYDSTHREIA